MAISSAGIGSGLDVESIVSQLVAIEKKPLQTAQKAAASLQSKISAVGQITSQMSALQDAAEKLATASNWNVKTASSTSSSAVAVSATSSAATGSVDVEVSQLAKGQAIGSAGVVQDAALSGGTLTIRLGQWSSDKSTFTPSSGSADVEIVIDPASATMSDIAQQINDAGAGVTATVLRVDGQEQLLVRSTTTGETNGFQISVTDSDGDSADSNGLSMLSFAMGNKKMTLGQAAQNTLASINGVPVSAASRQLTDVLPGVTLTVSQVTTEPVEVTVSRDQDGIKANIQAFVDAYNTLNATLSSMTKYDSSTQTAAVLQGDSSIVALQRNLRQAMTGAVSGLSYSRLSDVGLEVQANGSLSIDSAKLDSGFTNFDNLKGLFSINDSVTGQMGIAKGLFNLTSSLTGTDGMLSGRDDALKAAVDRNSDEQDRISDRIARTEARLRAQYTALDTKMAGLTALGSYMSQQITTWNKSSS